MQKRIWCYAVIALLFCSCGSTKHISYLQDLQDESAKISNVYTNIVKSGDLLNIVVSSTKPELAVPFNLYNIRNQMGTTAGTSTRMELEGYMVNSKGDIDFPVLGTLHVSGMTREELVNMLKERLTEYIEDPIVTVNFMNFKVTVAGEVNKPGVYNVTGDRISIIEAIAMAGDMSVYGKRLNVLLVRENEGVRTSVRLDFTSKDIVDSPYFYLQQNDIVYIEPIKQRARSISPFVNNLPLITSLGSLATSIAMVLINLSK